MFVHNKSINHIILLKQTCHALVYLIHSIGLWLQPGGTSRSSATTLTSYPRPGTTVCRSSIWPDSEVERKSSTINRMPWTTTSEIAHNIAGELRHQLSSTSSEPRRLLATRKSARVSNAQYSIASSVHSDIIVPRCHDWVKLSLLYQAALIDPDQWRILGMIGPCPSLAKILVWWP